MFKEIVRPAFVLCILALIVILAGFIFLVGWSVEMQKGIDFLLDRSKEVKSIAITPSGAVVPLKSTVLFRIPEPQGAATQPAKAATDFESLHQWLTFELG